MRNKLKKALPYAAGVAAGTAVLGGLHLRREKKDRIKREKADRQRRALMKANPTDPRYGDGDWDSAPARYKGDHRKNFSGPKGHHSTWASQNIADPKLVKQMKREQARSRRTNMSDKMNDLILLGRETIAIELDEKYGYDSKGRSLNPTDMAQNIAIGGALGGVAGQSLKRSPMDKKQARAAMRKKYGDDWSKRTGGKPLINPNTGKPYKTGQKAGILKGGKRAPHIDKHYKKLRAGRKGRLGYGMLAGAALTGIGSHLARRKDANKG